VTIEFVGHGQFPLTGANWDPSFGPKPCSNEATRVHRVPPPVLGRSTPSRPRTSFSVAWIPHGYAGQTYRRCRLCAWRGPAGAPTEACLRRQRYDLGCAPEFMVRSRSRGRLQRVGATDADVSLVGARSTGKGDSSGGTPRQLSSSSGVWASVAQHVTRAWSRRAALPSGTSRSCPSPPQSATMRGVLARRHPRQVR
jgi:hypothetical protein